MEVPFSTDSYPSVISSWPPTGKHILASYSDELITVYQAYKPSIGRWVVAHQSFHGCPEFSMDRMSWIKTNFLWMMYRSGWGTKKNQETILAIALKRKGFEEILGLSKRHAGDSHAFGAGADSSDKFGGDDVRIQWDPDHDPFGNKLERRAIQLGLRGRALQAFVQEWVVSVKDITEFVNDQREFVKSEQLHNLLQIPAERVFNPADSRIHKHIDLDVIIPPPSDVT